MKAQQHLKNNFAFSLLKTPENLFQVPQKNTKVLTFQHKTITDFLGQASLDLLESQLCIIHMYQVYHQSTFFISTVLK